MSYSVKQPSLSGRIGAGIGKGLAETVPKEIERYRLSQGLKELGQKKDLDPFQAYTELLSIPGITPQAIQGATELLKLKRQQQAYGSFGKNNSEQPLSSGGMTRQINPQQTQTEDLIRRANPELAREKSPEIMQPSEAGQPQTVPDNPTRNEYLSRFPFTPEMRNQSINNYIGLGFLPDEAKRLAADDEARYLKEPEVYQERLQQREQNLTNLRKEFQRQLGLKLQKDPSSKDIYKDISGSMLNRLERSMDRDLARNPNLSINDIANKWSEKAFELAKDNSKFDKLAGTEGIENIFKGKTLFNKLKALRQSYAETGNSEEFQNELQDRMNFSPQAAAKIAYGESPNIKKVIDEFRPATQKGSPTDASRRVAKEVINNLSPQDSIQSIVYSLRNKYRFFDESEFYQTIVNEIDNISLTPKQRRDLIDGTSAIIPHWADFFYLPSGEL